LIPQISLDVMWAGRGGELSAILTCFGTLDTLLLPVDGRVGVVSRLLLNLFWYLRYLVVRWSGRGGELSAIELVLVPTLDTYLVVRWAGRGGELSAIELVLVP
jgi:hypothetical protein